MSRDLPQSSEPITSMDQLTDYFRQGIKAPEARRVGMEHEKFVFRRADMTPVPYHGPDGIGQVFAELSRRYGYDPAFDTGNITAAERPNAEGKAEALTIEPGGQFELSGAPLVTMDAIEDELDRHLAEFSEVAADLGLVAVGAGLNGLNDIDQVPWMPKSRYGIMKRYMTQVGNLGHWMMKMTCTVQANFDYTSEADAVDMLRTALWLSPVISGMFARSPIWRRKPSGFMSTRCHVWTDTDPDRCGFPLFMLEDRDFSFMDYVGYTLDVPMYLIRREGDYIDMAGHSFRRFIEEGHQGHQATMGDYELHLSTIFPEVRMKRYIEVRGADAGPRDHMLALPALWKGLLYDAQSRAQARALVRDFTTPQRERLFDSAIRWSLQGAIPGTGDKDPRLIRELAVSLIELAADGLDRMAALEVPLAAPGERRFLEFLREAAAQEGSSPAHALLDRWHALGGDTAAWTLEQALTPSK